MKTDTIWADEAGIGVKFERDDNGKVKIAIVEYDTGKEISSAHVRSWRWERIVEALSQKENEGKDECVL